MYASTIHCWPARPVSRSSWIVGSATFTTVESRKTIVEPRIVAIRVRSCLRLTGSSLTNASRRERHRGRLSVRKLCEHVFVSETEARGLAHLPLELIEREIETLAARLSADNARWLALVAEFDRRQGWNGTGCRSTCEWVAWRCALNPRSAREQVRVARALRELPAIRAEFEAGALSYSKVRALTRVADREAEGDLIELARHATAAQLERMVRAARRVTAAEAHEQARDSFVRWSWDDEDGCLCLHAKLPPEEGALFLRALDAAREALAEQRSDERDERRDEAHDGSAGPLDASEPSGSAEPPGAPADQAPPSPSNAESLVAIAEHALARPPTGLAGGERNQLIVHIDVATFAADSPGASLTGPGACAVADGPGIAAETARRLACDCSLVPTLESAGRTLDVGRRTRSIPPAIRRALSGRDGRCQFPGCERHRFVDAHHVHHWAQGGETSLDNLVLLCRHHHRLVHEGGFAVTRSSAGELRFRRPDGAPIPRSPRPPAAAPAPLRPRHSREERGRAGPLLTGTGEPMDREACTEAVLIATAPAARAAGAPA